MRGLVLFIGLLLLVCGWAATTGPAAADECKGQCQQITVPEPVAAVNDKPVVTEGCEGGVCNMPPQAPVAQKYEQPRGVMSRVRNRVRQWRPFGGYFQRRRG